MRLTDEELIDIWRYFQYCCLPSIALARYAMLDCMKDIRKEKTFFRHETKQIINRLCNHMESLPSYLMSVNGENIRYMHIVCDNIEEQLEGEEEELHRAIYITFRNAKAGHLDCLTAMHYISVMLQIAVVTYKQCCKDLVERTGKDCSDLFQVYNLGEILEKWDGMVEKADRLLCPWKKGRKEEEVNLSNIRVLKAIDAIRKKYSDIETLRTAMRKSYPWSINFREDIPYEESVDYALVNS